MSCRIWIWNVTQTTHHVSITEFKCRNRRLCT